MNPIVFTQRANLYRLKPGASPRKENFELIYSGLRVNIQPAGKEFTIAEPTEAMGKLFQGFTSYSGCRNGMVLVTSGTATISGMRYTIEGVDNWETGPLGKTAELLLKVAIT